MRGSLFCDVGTVLAIGVAGMFGALLGLCWLII